LTAVNPFRFCFVLLGEVSMQGSTLPPSHVGESDQYQLWDAAYVLRSLSDADLREYEAHLRVCASCRRAVDELSGLPAILGQLTADDVAAIEERATESPVVPLRVGRPTSPPARAGRRGRVPRAAVLTMAAAVIALAVLVGTQFHWGHAAPARQAETAAVAMAPVTTTELNATVSMTSHDWGTQIDMNCTYPAETNAPDGNEPPAKLAMVVVGRDGSHDRLATWVAVEGARATPSGSTSIPIDEIAAVQIVSADTGTALLQRTV
jgi:hypothetical protein